MAKIYKVDGKFEIVNLESSGGGGAVDSVNGQTGAVVLDAADVGADVSGAAATAQSNAEAYADSLASNYDPAGAAATAQSNAESYTDSGLATKQDTLVSGTNIKTINSSSILGSGDLVISSSFDYPQVLFTQIFS